MKKITRIKKNKIVETVKTVLIVILLLCCLFSGYQILETYREQTVIDNFWLGPDVSSNDSTAETATEKSPLSLFFKLSEPEIILSGSFDGRALIEADSDDFKIVADAANRIISSIYKIDGSNILDCEESEWKNVLKGESLYIRYPAERFTEYEASFYETEGSALVQKIESYDQIAIALEKEDKVSVILKDSKKGKFIKVTLISNDRKIVKETIEKYKNSDGREYLYAYELNLDESFNDNAELDSMTIIPQREVSASDILIYVPKIYKTGLNFTKTTEFTTSLINIFGYNPNTIREYANSEDALIFVGETGTLSVYPEGRIEYKALGKSEGVLLSTANTTKASAVSAGMYNLIEKILKVSGVNTDNNDFDIKFTKMPQNIKANEKKEVFFDYYVDGKKVILSELPSICAIIENGVLTELRMQIKSIKKVEGKTELPDLADEISLFREAQMDKEKIITADAVYRYQNSEDRTKASWNIEGER